MIARALPLLLVAACQAREPPSPTPKASAPAATTSASAAPPPASAAPPLPTPPPSPSAPSRPPPPEEPKSAERACRTDGDCALAPDDCRSCPPCEATWRRAVNRATLKKIEAERARGSCPPITCARCEPPPTPPGAPPAETGYIGELAVCVQGQCTPR